MKTLSIALAFIIVGSISLRTSAQTFGLKGGLSLANVLDKDEDGTYSDEFKLKPGFHVGAVADIPLSEIFSFEPGIMINCKGFKVKDEMGGADFTVNTNLLYLDIPIMVKAGTDISDKVRLYGAIGPYIGVGLTGKIKVKVEYQGDTETETEDIEWGNDENEDMIKRPDFGITFGAGVEINVFQVSIAYDLGLSNNSPYTDYGTTYKNRVLRFSFAYLFVK